MSVTFRGGLLPNDPTKPRLRLTRYLTGVALPAAPAAVDWDAKVKTWPMFGNDRLGCCVFAMIGHAIQAITANADTETDVTDADIIEGYSAVTGYSPADPSTDRGTVIQDALNWWRKSGMSGHKIVAFAQVDVANEAEMQQACALFGVVLFGMSFPKAAMDQFNAGQPWDVAADDGGIEGGHAILGARYDTATGQWYVITWAKEQPVTFAFIAKYFGEAWAVVSREWVSAAGATPSGMDLAAFGADFAAMTGQADPFPSPSPVPLPLPGSLGVAVQALRVDPIVLAWVAAKHSGQTRHVADMVRAVVDVAQ